MASHSGTSKDIAKDTDTEKDYSLREGLSELRKDASAVKEDLGTLRTDATQMASHTAQEAIEAVKQGAKSAGEMARSAGDSAKEFHGALCEKVAARPTTSLLLALGTGIVLGKILSRR